MNPFLWLAVGLIGLYSFPAFKQWQLKREFTALGQSPAPGIRLRGNPHNLDLLVRIAGDFGWDETSRGEDEGREPFALIEPSTNAAFRRKAEMVAALYATGVLVKTGSRASRIGTGDNR